MSEVVLIPCGARLLALDRDEYERALERGDAYLPAAPSTVVNGADVTLLTSAQMQEATGIAKSWFERQAREQRIPFRKLGRYTRFVLKEVVESETFRRDAVPAGGLLKGPTGSHNRHGART